MYNRSRDLVLRWLKVPPEPHPPFGDPASLRVFRAGTNYFNLRLFGWGVTQVFALAGIIFWVVVFLQVEQAIEVRHRAGQTAVAPTSAKNFKEYIEKIGAGENPAVKGSAPQPAAPATAVATAAPDGQPATAKARPEPAKKRPRVQVNGWAGFKLVLVELGMWLPPWSFPLIWALKIVGFLLYLVQVPFTYAVMRLDYEMRWYVVTDRSLRIRTGVWKVQEITMSFANLQQVEVSQGPLQRLLRLADVKVQSAGGSDRPQAQQGPGDSLHTGHFHGVENAQEIRDLIQARLRHFRESGLGDPEELRRAALAAASAVPPATGAGPVDADVLAAARELAAEAKALRLALG